MHYKVIFRPLLDFFLCELTWKMPVKERATEKNREKRGIDIEHNEEVSFYWTWLFFLNFKKEKRKECIYV